MKTVETVGGWIWYTNMIKKNTDVPIDDYKELLKKYMSNIPWQKVVEEMNK